MKQNPDRQVRPEFREERGHHRTCLTEDLHRKAHRSVLTKQRVAVVRARLSSKVHVLQSVNGAGRET